MNDSNVYLKPNLVIEPLVDKWYAWSHLIPPVTTAMNITGRHFKIMNSYVQAAHIHAAAVKDPKLLGGPFMDFKTNRAGDIKALVNDTKEARKDLLELSKAIIDLDNMLKTYAKGYSLEPLYEMVPEILKGYVELTYDLNHNPSYRLFEPLLYNSEYYDPTRQSIALWLTTNDERPFVLSTPRLPDQNVLHLDIPFSSEAIDELAKMKRNAKPFNYIKHLLSIPDEQLELFKTFFTEEPFIPYESYQGDKIRMRYFGHACILIETSTTSILVDPLISYYGYSSTVEHFSDYDLPDIIDYVLITHNHQDHILFETLLPLRHKIRNLVVPATTSGALQDPNLKHMFNAIGFKNVIEIQDFESHRFNDCTIQGIPFIGEHSDLNIHSKSCYHVQIGDFSVLFVADSCNIESNLYKHIHRIVGDINILFLGMECEGAPLSWLYGPLLTHELPRDKDRSRTLSGSNFRRGKDLIDIFSPKEAYVYAMGMEPWLEFISSKRYTDQDHPIVESSKLVDYCLAKGITAERLYGEKELMRPALLSSTPLTVAS
jgi:L-ascorbate metabolism protein UlaG (beta-lactamase superfamily)